MNNIKQRAHQYAVAHEHNGNGVALMRAYTAGATDERMIKNSKERMLYNWKSKSIVWKQKCETKA